LAASLLAARRLGCCDIRQIHSVKVSASRSRSGGRVFLSRLTGIATRFLGFRGRTGFGNALLVVQLHARTELPARSIGASG
jgi:hypothetical protein